MRVYIAAPWVRKSEAEDAARLFEAAGHVITKKWWTHREVPGYLVNEEDNGELALQAHEDLHGVVCASAFVLLNLEKSEGKAVETGIALGVGARRILVGPRSNIFHYLPGWIQVNTVEEALRALES